MIRVQTRTRDKHLQFVILWQLRVAESAAVNTGCHYFGLVPWIRSSFRRNSLRRTWLRTTAPFQNLHGVQDVRKIGPFAFATLYWSFPNTITHARTRKHIHLMYYWYTTHNEHLTHGSRMPTRIRQSTYYDKYVAGYRTSEFFKTLLRPGKFLFFFLEISYLTR